MQFSDPYTHLTICRLREERLSRDARHRRQLGIDALPARSALARLLPQRLRGGPATSQGPSGGTAASPARPATTRRRRLG